MDLQRLISEVQARPAIWDQKNTHYHNRDVILRLWGEIAKACDVSSDVAKSKWKHLRDNFRNELKKTYRGKPAYDGSGSPPNVSEHESKWVWFKSLQFLRDQMNSRVIGGCGHSQNGVGTYQTSLEETQIEPQIDIVEGDEEAHFEDIDGGESCTSLMTSEEVLNQAGLPSRKRGKIGRKRFLMDGMLESMDYHSAAIERKRYEQALPRRVSIDEDDDTYHFLMSVRSPMRSLPLERQMYVRLKIQEIILNEMTALGQHAGRSHDAASQQDTKTQTRAGAAGIPTNSILQNRSPERATDDNYFS